MTALDGTHVREFAVLIFAGKALVSSADRLSLVFVRPVLRQIVGLWPFCFLERLVFCAWSLEGGSSSKLAHFPFPLPLPLTMLSRT